MPTIRKRRVTKTHLPIKVVERINATFSKIQKVDNTLYRTFREEFYLAHLGDVGSVIYYELSNLLFHSITGEEDFGKFEDRFDAPGHRTGKPVAWTTRFIPDLIRDEIMSDRSTKEKVTKVMEMYDQCVKIEREAKNGQL